MKLKIKCFIKIKWFSYVSGGQADGYFIPEKNVTEHYPLIMVNNIKVYKNLKLAFSKNCIIKIFNLKKELKIEYICKEGDLEIKLFNPSFIYNPSDDYLIKFVPKLKKKNSIIKITS